MLTQAGAKAKAGLLRSSASVRQLDVLLARAGVQHMSGALHAEELDVALLRSLLGSDAGEFRSSVLELGGTPRDAEALAAALRS